MLVQAKVFLIMTDKMLKDVSLTAIITLLLSKYDIWKA